MTGITRATDKAQGPGGDTVSDIRPKRLKRAGGAGATDGKNLRLVQKPLSIQADRERGFLLRPIAGRPLAVSRYDPQVG